MAIPLRGAVAPTPQLVALQTRVRMQAPFRSLYKLPLPGGALVKGLLVQQQRPLSLRWARRGNHLGASQQCQSRKIINNNGGTAGGFSERDEDYVDSSIIEAVEVKSTSREFLIKMRDGRSVKCVPSKPDGRHLPYYARQPTIVLKMEDGSGLLLPIISFKQPSTMSMEALRHDAQGAPPTVYEVMRDIIELAGYQATLVRVTRRDLHEAYYGRVYLRKIDDGTSQKMVSLDLRLFDAIHLAELCKLPIQVNKQLAYDDGVRIVTDSERLPIRHPRTSLGVILMDLDRPQEDSCAAAEEFDLVRNMTLAVVEERYSDAARVRDELSQLRIKTRPQNSRQSTQI